VPIVIQLCEVDLLCANNAAVYLRIRKGDRVSRPIGCCANHREETERKIRAEDCSVEVEPIAATAA
jgi:hypothetical protein